MAVATYNQATLGENRANSSAPMGVAMAPRKEQQHHRWEQHHPEVPGGLVAHSLVGIEAVVLERVAP